MAASSLKVVVVGGGMSGLSTAWHIKQLAATHKIPLHLQVLEADATVGGNIRTEVVSHEQGQFLVEWGPNGVLDSKPETLDLCKALGLEKSLISANEAAAKRYLFVDGRLQQLPGSPGAFMRSPILSIGARMRVMREPFVKPLLVDDESIFDFAARRLGIHAAERLIDPFVSGIFAGDPKELSVHAAFPRLPEMERAHGSLIKAQKAMKKARSKSVDEGQEQAGPKGRLVSLRHGMGQLIEALHAKLSAEIQTNARVDRVRYFEDGWVVERESGESIDRIDKLIIATPSMATSRILAGLERGFMQPLQGIDYSAVSVVALGFNADDIDHALDGFGFLVPAIENREILGCLWSSSIYPGQRSPDGTKLLRVMVGGARAPRLALRDDDALLSSVRRELGDILGVHGDPLFTRIIRWTNAIPQYGLGHLRRVAEVESLCEKWPGLHVTGNAFRGVAVNDCARESLVVANRALGLSRGAD